jgi:hypothetical protein
MRWDDSKTVKHAYYAVASRNRPDDFRWLTVFAVLDHMTCSLPTGREGVIDTINYVFRHLTKAEFDTHIAFESLEVKDSDHFAIANDDTSIEAFCNRRIADLDNVLNKSKS